MLPIAQKLPLKFPFTSGREVAVGGLWRERGMVGDHGVVVESQCDDETAGVGRGVGW